MVKQAPIWAHQKGEVRDHEAQNLNCCWGERKINNCIAKVFIVKDKDEYEKAKFSYLEK